MVATVTSAVIGAGLFLTTVQIQGEYSIGSSVIFSYMIAALPAVFISLCYVTLASAMPKMGRDYIFISRILDPYLGFSFSHTKNPLWDSPDVVSFFIHLHKF